MMATWDGITDPSTLSPAAVKEHHKFINAAKMGQWDFVLHILRIDNALANSSRLGGKAGYTVLHHAAYNGAPVAVVRQLVDCGCWRTVQTSNSKLPVQIAQDRHHSHLIEILTPVQYHDIKPEILNAIQPHFHDVIRGRAANLIDEQKLKMPELLHLPGLQDPAMWFPIPGMYGGFRFHLIQFGSEWLLKSFSGSRIIGGSGQTHLVSQYGSLLMEAYFDF